MSPSHEGTSHQMPGPSELEGGGPASLRALGGANSSFPLCLLELREISAG